MEGLKSVTRIVHIQLTMTEVEADTLATMLQNPFADSESITARKVRSLVFNTIRGPAQPDAGEKT